MKLFCSWNSLKEIKVAHSLDMYYYDKEYNYEIMVINSVTTWYTEIWKDVTKCAGLNIEENNTSLSDFVDNFKIGAQKL